jgi:hypothetical protein
MKKILVALSLLVLTGSAIAQHHHGFRHHGNHGYHRGPSHGWWVAPVVIGVIGYELGRQQVIVQQQPVIIQQQPIQTICTEWKEVQGPDGRIYKERICNQ